MSLVLRTFINAKTFKNLKGMPEICDRFFSRQKTNIITFFPRFSWWNSSPDIFFPPLQRIFLLFQKQSFLIFFSTLWKRERWVISFITLRILLYVCHKWEEFWQVEFYSLILQNVGRFFLSSSRFFLFLFYFPPFKIPSDRRSGMVPET